MTTTESNAASVSNQSASARRLASGETVSAEPIAVAARRADTEEVVVRMQDVHKSYQLGRSLNQAIRGVSLEIQRGEFTALVGASGSGKSTLLNLIGGIDSPDSGAIVVGSRSLAGLDDAGLSRLRNEVIGFVFQTFNLVPVLTIYENVELPLSIRLDVTGTERRARVTAAMAAVGVDRYATQRPDNLSGGERQRVAIARALVTRPDLVLADEPTANLDSRTAHQILDLMRALNQEQGITFLFSTHDERVIDSADRVIRLMDGKISEC